MMVYNSSPWTHGDIWEFEKLLWAPPQLIVKLWNSLPQDVVTATNLDGFKRGLDKFLEEKAINGYEP